MCAVSCGANHNLALCGDGAVYAWGYGDMAALGLGHSRDVATPRRISFEDAGFRGAVKVAQVEGGGQHSMIIAEVQGAAAGAANH